MFNLDRRVAGVDRSIEAILYIASHPQLIAIVVSLAEASALRRARLLPHPRHVEKH